MGNAKVARNCYKESALKCEFTDRLNKKRKLSKQKKRKRRQELNKKRTLTIGIYKNGAKSKEICTALNETNKARLQGDVFMLLNGETSAKKVVEAPKVICNKKNLPEKTVVKKVENNTSMINCTPRRCYKTFCSTLHSDDFKVPGNLINESAVADSVRKIKRNLRQFYADAFRRQILRANATKDRSVVTKSSGLVNALFSMRNFNFANMEVPAERYSEHTELLLKPMNNIRLDQETFSEDPQENKSKNLAPSFTISNHVTKVANKLAIFNEELKLLPNDSFTINWNEGSDKNGNINPKIISQPLERKLSNTFDLNVPSGFTSLEDSFNTLNTKSLTCFGKEIIMNRYLADIATTAKQNAIPSESFKGDDKASRNYCAIIEDSVQKCDKKNLKHIPAIFRRANIHNLHKQGHEHVAVHGAENVCLAFTANKNFLVTDNKVPAELLVDESSVSEMKLNRPVVSQREMRCETPSFVVKSQNLPNSKVQYGKAKFVRETQSISPIDKRDIPRVHEIREINKINNPKCNDSKIDKKQNCLENSYLKLNKHKPAKQKKRNVQRHINNDELFGLNSIETSNCQKWEQPTSFGNNFPPTYDPKYQKIYNPLFSTCKIVQGSLDESDNNSNNCELQYFNYPMDRHMYNNDIEINKIGIENSTDSRSKPSVSSGVQSTRESSKTFFTTDYSTTQKKSTFLGQRINGSRSNRQYFAHSGYSKNVPRYVLPKVYDSEIIGIPERVETILYPPRNKDSGKKNPMKTVPIVCGNQDQNALRIDGAQRIVQPIKYIAIENSQNIRERIPLYLHVPLQQKILELPHGPINVVKYNEQELNSAANIIYVPREEFHERTALRVAHRNAVPVYGRIMESGNLRKGLIETIPVDVKQSYSRAFAKKPHLVDESRGISVPQYYVVNSESDVM